LTYENKPFSTTEPQPAPVRDYREEYSNLATRKSILEEEAAAIEAELTSLGRRLQHETSQLTGIETREKKLVIARHGET